MGEKEYQNKGHSRESGCGSHSGIFDARCESFISLGHSRMFLSGIFDACRYENRKPYLVNDSMMRDPGQKPSGMTLWDEQQTTAVFCPPCGESTAHSGVRGLLNKDTSFYNPPMALQATSPIRGADKSGFTLIELLVVVLIIGILAAVALPQYQKAVEKARATQALTLLKSLAQAAEVYYTARNEYPSSFDQLDVDLPPGWTGNTVFFAGGDYHSNGEWSIGIEKNSSFNIIYIGKISGKYAGAGFAYFLKAKSFEQAEGKIVCVETIAGNIEFQQADGAYCEKIMKGTYYKSGSNRIYFL